MTALFVFVGVGLLLIVAILVTAFAFSIVARSENEQIGAVARQVPWLVGLYTEQHQSLRQAAPAIAEQLERPGVHVVIFDSRHKPVNGMPPGRQ
ncbi:hypothetical protein, partial [Pseudomonas aeruginosa]|uniref:hypothetical protein n=1 Tax=Pseudomonas aeruginosa TaxID=287 RepID=UPI0011BE5A44